MKKIIQFILERGHLNFIPSARNNYRPLFFEGRFLLYLLLSVLILKLALIPFVASLPSSRFFADVTKSALFQETNQVRIAQGLQPLKDNILLDKAAQAKAQNMLQNGYFAHTSPSGLSPWYWFKQVKYPYRYAGENLAIGFLNSDEVTKAWEQSPEHRRNLLNPHYEDMGLAVIKGPFQGHDTTLVVQLFGQPAVTSSPSAVLKPSSPSLKVLPPQKSTVKGAEKALATKPEAAPPIKIPARKLQPNIEKNSPSFQMVKFLDRNYEKITQNILLAVLAFISLAIILLIIIEVQNQAPDLIAKGGLAIILLVSLLLIGEGSILKIIPHHLLIA